MASKKTKVKAEKTIELRASTKDWIETVNQKYVLDNHHKMLLELAGRAWDRAFDAGLAIGKAGSGFYTDSRGTMKPIPAIKIEVDSSNLFARLIRELGLDIENENQPRPNKIRRSY
jgi:phage terminase small subunit